MCLAVKIKDLNFESMIAYKIFKRDGQGNLRGMYYGGPYNTHNRYKVNNDDDFTIMGGMSDGGQTFCYPPGFHGYCFYADAKEELRVLGGANVNYGREIWSVRLWGVHTLGLQEFSNERFCKCFVASEMDLIRKIE